MRRANWNRVVNHLKSSRPRLANIEFASDSFFLTAPGDSPNFAFEEARDAARPSSRPLGTGSDFPAPCAREFTGKPGALSGQALDQLPQRIKREQIIRPKD